MEGLNSKLQQINHEVPQLAKQWYVQRWNITDTFIFIFHYNVVSCSKSKLNWIQVTKDTLRILWVFTQIWLTTGTLRL